MICESFVSRISSDRELLSFLAVEEDLGLAADRDGWVVRHVAGERRPRPHRHAELEVNLVVSGTASYVLGERRYELSPGTLAWLFPGQDHVLLDESADHVLWWAVFRPSLVARVATLADAEALSASDPSGDFSRHLPYREARRLGALLADLQDVDDSDLANAGLAYLLRRAWQAFVDSDEVVEGVAIHPAVEQVARLLSDDSGSGDLPALARACGLSPSHLSRVFKVQMGISISRFRNQQRLDRFLSLTREGHQGSTIAAAHASGFGSYAQFYRVVRDATGASPSSLRARAGQIRLTKP
jgi:AraC-like DNA-binding protein